MNNLFKSFYLTVLITVLFSCDEQTKGVHTNILTAGWKFKSVTDADWKKAKVPGTVHSDLLRNGEIEDPFYRLNEHELQWIDKKDWAYQTTFEVSGDELNASNAVLEFLGLDTYSQVFLNDSLILESDNMFRTYRVDVKSLLKASGNELRVVFASPIRKGLEKYDAQGFKIPVSDNDLAEIGKVEGNKKVSIYTRKAGYHFGWDWGPRLVSSGIWRPVKLISWNAVKVEDLFVKQESLSDEAATLSAQIEVAPAPSLTDATVDLLLDGQTIASQTIDFSTTSSATIPFTINHPKRWWPNGMGDQNLYEVTAKVTAAGYSDSQTQRIGLRTIEIVQEPDSIGTSFYFKVNGIPTFMKGANYIPQDVFLDRVKEEQYDHILNSAKAANMNMLRVWGGGIYENDDFYDKCDELGLLVWQDFMFACAMFPGDDAFLENVRLEAIDNVKRLRNHTSIALWCGNNEILSAWENWGWKNREIQEQSPEVADEIWKAYDDIFHQILPEVVSNYDRDRFYWPSSPGSEFGKTENLTQGDAHYWMVWWGKRPFDEYNRAIPRFMSEFGFQSFPNMPTINKYTSPEDHDIYSEVMKSHQRSSIGNVTIDEYMKRHYQTPKDFESFIYTSQVLQAQGIQIGIEAHRRNRARCMGSLYWQINDCWPVASWSGIDYYGNWKALHYQVKRSFETLILSFENTEEGLKIHVVSDSLKEVNTTLALSLITMDGKEVKSWTEPLAIKANAAGVYYSIPSGELDADPTQVILTGQLVADNEVLASGNFNLVPFKEMAFTDPELSHKITEAGAYIEVEVTAKNFAKRVYLSDGTVGNFSDNYFDMLPNTTKKVRMEKKGKDIATFRSNFKINSLFDTYEATIQ